ncbi:type III pantothenate kinase [Lysobacter sp. A03]|uniref:type III pantothenate kinase n=1 Tax=Lysobacter sp. A03 TaxID=1199154 RepID=UPI0005B6DC98|nr:type III pantothenate kinase [Lysobacter sp. A03]KIQ96421.1 Pantothenate kinase type III, CoaX-like protein [Lysobacter sp. A03]
MQRWVLDLGNTRLKIAPLQESGEVGESIAMEHRGADLDALAAGLPPRMEVAYLASVTDEGLRVALLDVLAARCQRISLARTQRRWGDLRIAYADPARLGVDRFLAIIAARAHATRVEPGAPVLVCGVGTALTLDLVDAQGRHLGGRIAPSPTLMRQALNQQVAQLSSRGGSYVEFAVDTPDALASGCVGAALGLIQRSLSDAGSRLGTAPVLYLHGGGGEELRSLLPQARWSPRLVLEGLAQWAAIEKTA